MRVLDPGHLYELDTIDEVGGWADEYRRLAFVKRIGDRYPGNQPPARSGTTTQEVIRALIDRMNHVEGQKPNHRNQRVLSKLRGALRELEMRAAEERGDQRAAGEIYRSIFPEAMATCDHCGHVECRRAHDGG